MKITECLLHSKLILTMAVVSVISSTPMIASAIDDVAPVDPAAARTNSSGDTGDTHGSMMKNHKMMMKDHKMMMKDHKKMSKADASSANAGNNKKKKADTMTTDPATNMNDSAPMKDKSMEPMEPMEGGDM